MGAKAAGCMCLCVCVCVCVCVCARAVCLVGGAPCRVSVLVFVPVCLCSEVSQWIDPRADNNHASFLSGSELWFLRIHVDCVPQERVVWDQVVCSRPLLTRQHQGPVAAVVVMVTDLVTDVTVPRVEVGVGLWCLRWQSTSGETHTHTHTYTLAYRHTHTHTYT